MTELFVALIEFVGLMFCASLLIGVCLSAIAVLEYICNMD